MAFFVTGFFLIYGLLHLYVFLRAKVALGLGPAACIPVAFFMVVMIIAPVLVRLSENAGFGMPARITAYGGYTWMGLLFLFICSSVMVDLYRLALYAGSMIAGNPFSWLTLSRRSYFLLSVAIAAGIGLYGWFEARAIRSEHVTIVTSKIPSRISPLRIVQISDVHLGLIVRKRRLERILERVKEAHPDILVSTGDLVDGQMNDLDGITEQLQAVRPRFGKFAVTGNHEFYAGLGQALAFTNRAGFRLLQGKSVVVGDAVNIVGVDDPAGPGFGSSNEGEKALLSSVSPKRFTLFLKHRPSVDPESAGLFDLQLSGHVHDGQIFPFRLITRLFYRFVAGLYPLSEHSELYVSRGSGTWGPPIRFLAPPEVTVIEIRRPPPEPAKGSFPEKGRIQH
jgi:uncharacterized protein